MTDYVDNRRATSVVRERNDHNWAWLLLLPLFFFTGWVMNDALEQQPVTGPEAGIGGAPLSEEDNRPATPSPVTDDRMENSDLNTLEEVSPTGTEWLPDITIEPSM